MSMREHTELAHRLLNVVHDGGIEIDAQCPFHGEDRRPSLRFNADSGLWYCHACHESGNANTLSRRITGQGVAASDFGVISSLLEADLEDFDRQANRARALYVQRHTEDEMEELVDDRTATIDMREERAARRRARHARDGSGLDNDPLHPLTFSVPSNEDDPAVENESDSSDTSSGLTAESLYFDEDSYKGSLITLGKNTKSYSYAELFGVGVSTQTERVFDESTLSRYVVNNPRVDTYWTGSAQGKYGVERSFDPQWVKEFGMGYDPLTDTHVIPIRNEQGFLLGTNVRDVNGPAKYKLPSGFKRKSHLFGGHMIGQYEVADPYTAVIVEGAPDAVACWHVGYQGLAVYGSSVSETQIKLLHRMGIRNVILAFDDDKAGRLAQTNTWSMLRRFFRGSVRWPIHPAQRHNALASGYDTAELFRIDPDALARTLDKVRFQ